LAQAETVNEYLVRRAQEVNGWLEKFLPAESTPPETIHRAMRYSMMAGGKRLRPALVLASGEAFGASAEHLMPAACAVEMIHTYSLIHDDLPAMDNDDLRRGRPTCHKVFGEAKAILAGDALLTLAFNVLAARLSCDSDRKVRVIAEVSRIAGTIEALIGGQVADIENEGRDVSAQTLEYIHRSKTGALIRGSVLIGGIIAGAGQAELEKLSDYGARIGLAFQIADDVLDVTASSEQLGKTAGKDQAAKKATYPAVHGIEASRRRALELVNEAVAIVSGLDAGTEMLASMARFIVARSS